jgi:thymidine kinase
VPDDKLVLLGQVQEYEPLSRGAYYKIMQEEAKMKKDIENQQKASHD